ncbi:MAG: efflux RND transporter periplasmic adaptor subunit [Myxococcales bacterium]|nr:efflux RND transporter periplasmic adaptor subunit [Myxococcales bacterium]
MWLAALWVGGCQPQQTDHEPRGTFMVTNPLRTDTELSKEYVAQIRAIQHIELRALERGYLQDIFVDEGQQIEVGQKMFQIMPLIYQAEVSKAKAEVDLAKIEYKNTRLLADEDIVAPSELALAKAKVDKANAELSLAETHKRLTEIQAPFDGIMGRFQVRKGSLVEDGELLTTLSDNSSVWVYFNVSEREYLEYQSRSAEGRTPQVRLVMANGELFDEPGRVETIEADFNNETGNIAFRATFPNPKGLLRHGETGKIVMSTPLKDALLIPQEATFEILDRQFVFVVDDDGTVSSRPITVAAEMPHVYVVESGLHETDEILMDGLRKVRDGDVIDVDYEEPAEVFAHLELPAE